MSYTTYYNKGKRDNPNLKVSRPIEDICNLCYSFAHCLKFFADHMMRCVGLDDGDDDNDDQWEEANNDIGNGNDPEVVDELLQGESTLLSQTAPQMR